jgi:hypothetical protein
MIYHKFLEDCKIYLIAFQDTLKQLLLFFTHYT